MSIEQNVPCSWERRECATSLLHNEGNNMAIEITRQLVVSEGEYSTIVKEREWDFATLLASITIPDRKVSQIKLMRIAFPEKSLRDCKLIVEAAMGNCEVF